MTRPLTGAQSFVVMPLDGFQSPKEENTGTCQCAFVSGPLDTARPHTTNVYPPLFRIKLLLFASTHY